MKHLFRATAALALFLTTSLSAQTPDAGVDPVAAWNADRTRPLDAAGLDLDAFQWVARPVVVFADSPNDPQFVQQMDLLAEEAEELALRDVVVIFDTAPDAPSDIRLDLRPRGFMLTLVGKDGQVRARKSRPWDVRELSRSIDKMPLRQQEMRDRRGQDR